MKSFSNTLDLLEKYPKPLKKVIFLYESKDTQELKEFEFLGANKEAKVALDKFDALNIAVDNDIVPAKEKSFNCNSCRYRETCNLND